MYYQCLNRKFTVHIIGLMIIVMALAAPPKVLALDTGQTLRSNCGSRSLDFGCSSGQLFVL